MPPVGRFCDRPGPIKQSAFRTKPTGDGIRGFANGGTDRSKPKSRRRFQIGQQIYLAGKQIVVIETFVGRRQTVIEVLDPGRDRFLPWAVPWLVLGPLRVTDAMN